VEDEDSSYNDNDKSTFVITSAGGAPPGLFVINSTSGEITLTRPVRYSDTPGSLGKYVYHTPTHYMHDIKVI